MWVKDGSTSEGDWVSTCHGGTWTGSDGNMRLGNCEDKEVYICES